MESYEYVIISIIISVMILVILAKFYIFLTTSECTSQTRLDGKTVIITGCNTGIGKEAALGIASRGARVIMACRNLETANKAREEIVTKTGNSNIIVQKLDLQSLDSVRQFSKRIHESESRLDVLINNAGMHGLGKTFTNDGLYVGMQVNHFGPFLLTNLLIDMLINSAPSRIINTASLVHIFSLADGKNLNEPYTFDMYNYCNTKLCNMWMTKELARRLENTQVTCNSLHPGVVQTDFCRNCFLPLKLFLRLWGYIFFKTPTQGAQTIIYLAVDEMVKNISGKHFQECAPTSWYSRRAANKQLALNMWKASAEYVKLGPEEKHSVLWPNLTYNV